MKFANRNTKIIATLGPASATREVIARLVKAGVNVFRLNFSHGSHVEHQSRVEMIRDVERSVGRPIGILMDLQGPKLRLGQFVKGRVALAAGASFRLDLLDEPGDEQRVPLPHEEIFAALAPGDELLVDDGKVRLRVMECGSDYVQTTVLVPGVLSDRKGVNLPHTVLPLSALTEKDRNDLAFGLALGVSWVALSFVQRASDIMELRDLIQGRASIIAKLEKPAAIKHMHSIIEVADAVMVARGDLGVEMTPEEVPLLQRHIVSACRAAGKPVVIATQMLESMLSTPVPTRAEVSDIATAVYAGVDAVMLSAESASGAYPVESVEMMDRIIRRVESDMFPLAAEQGGHRLITGASSNAFGAAVRAVADIVPLSVTVTYTTSGASALHIARERPSAPIIGLTPNPVTARRLTLVWGVHPVHSQDASNVEEMISYAVHAATEAGLADATRPLAIVAGMPFGIAGTTNLLHIVWPLTQVAMVKEMHVSNII